VVDVLLLVEVAVEVARVVLVVVLLAAPPGRHWLYHWLLYVQVQPDSHVVGPVHPCPPHCPYPGATLWARAVLARVTSRERDFIVNLERIL
jgi:hypothetical protein